MAKNAYHDYLRKVPLFSGLDDDELDEVGLAATELQFEAGKVLMKEGQDAHEMVVVLEGTLEVTRGGAHVADIGPGSFAGEMALLTRGHRNSTVTAKTDIVVLHIDGRSFSAVLDDVPQIAVKMLPVVAARVTANSDHHSH
jgi:CRP/FNR family transcriptional regulator/CRP/FNR family cyclic AMP-dependent transcriptional regulator